ncbi:uncharacterized protein ig2599ANME_1002 [groundwater metagenome]
MPVEKIPSGIERLLLPKLSSIEGELKEFRSELKAINTRIDSTDAKIEGLRKEILSKFETTDNKIETLNKIVIIKFESLEQHIPVIEKITALELKIADIEKRLALA